MMNGQLVNYVQPTSLKLAIVVCPLLPKKDVYHYLSFFFLDRKNFIFFFSLCELVCSQNVKFWDSMVMFFEFFENTFLIRTFLLWSLFIFLLQLQPLTEIAFTSNRLFLYLINVSVEYLMKIHTKSFSGLSDFSYLLKLTYTKLQKFRGLLRRWHLPPHPRNGSSLEGVGGIMFLYIKERGWQL